MMLHRLSQPAQGARRSRGFSLIELMVSLVIGMGLIITMGVLSQKFETSKREQSTSSDLSGTSAFLSYDLDRQIRSAGSGFTNGYADTFACALNVSKSNAQILPAPVALPDPFGSVPQAITLVPLAVYPATGSTDSDTIQIMTATGGVGEVSTQLKYKSVNTNQLQLVSNVGIEANDLLLITEKGRPCMIEQVKGLNATTPDIIDLDGAYYASVINGQALNDRGTSASVNAKAFNIGNASNGNPPMFHLLGVNGSNQLVRYDLMRFNNGGSGGNQPIPITDGVMMMRTLYGVDTSGDGKVDSWVRPGTGSFTAANVTTNSAIARQIVAIKIAMVLRSDTIEDQSSNAKTTATRSTFFVAPEKLTLFTSQATTLRTDYEVTDRQRRHLVVEFTVPLRNQLASLRTTTPD